MKDGGLTKFSSPSRASLTRPLLLRVIAWVLDVCVRDACVSKGCLRTRGRLRDPRHTPTRTTRSPLMPILVRFRARLLATLS